VLVAVDVVALVLTAIAAAAAAAAAAVLQLTRLLEDSLGGSSKTLLVVNCRYGWLVVQQAWHIGLLRLAHNPTPTHHPMLCGLAHGLKDPVSSITHHMLLPKPAPTL